MKGKYMCHTDWYLDGRLICAAGKEYEIVEAPSKEDAGYCDIRNCEDGNTTWTTFSEISEYFDGRGVF